MAQPVNERVLVLNPTRVHAALAALIEATAGPQVAAPIGSSVAVGAIGRFVEATVTVLDVAAGHRDDDFATIRALPERRTVIAVGTATAAGIRAPAGRNDRRLRQDRRSRGPHRHHRGSCAMPARARLHHR